MVADWINVQVKEVKRETPDAVTISLQYPPDKKEQMNFKPGQYLTVRWHEGGKEFRRSYSISSVPEDDFISITIKEVKGGKISPKLCRSIKGGDAMEVLPPEGRFIADFGPDYKRNLYLICAGSGITPLMSILRTALEKEPRSNVILLYGNKTEEQIIFKDQLEQLSSRHKGQLYIYHTLTRADGDGFLKSLFGKKKINWDGWKGRINEGRIQQLLEMHPRTQKDDLFFLCGPGELIQTTEKALKEIGVGDDHIKKEYFTTLDPDASTARDARDATLSSMVKVHLRGQELEVEVKDKTILDTLLDSGVDAPYSCHAGACATCMARVIKGKVEMEVCFSLSDKEIENGYILACQAHPSTPEVEITFDE